MKFDWLELRVNISRLPNQELLPTCYKRFMDTLTRYAWAYRYFGVWASLTHATAVGKSSGSPGREADSRSSSWKSSTTALGRNNSDSALRSVGASSVRLRQYLFRRTWFSILVSLRRRAFSHRVPTSCDKGSGSTDRFTRERSIFSEVYFIRPALQSTVRLQRHQTSFLPFYLLNLIVNMCG